SIRGDSMLAKVAVLDPLLTISMPPAITANTGMDALTQAIESFVSKASNTLSDYYAKQAIEYLWNNIEKVYLNGNDIDSREKMLYGSTLSALSFSNAKLGAVHGFAHPIGVIHSISHGLICGVLLPYVMKFNLDGDLPQVIKKFSWIAQIMDGSIDSEPNKKSASYAIESIFNLLKNLHMPSTLSELNINTDHIPRIVNETKGSSLANNPRNTDKVSLTKILENAL
ncbi:MAG: iron-containing alcohol dehydrogenase, partial [archaeon]|nr:iron-containing alcohol dehydrogenase [archaeon]